MGKGYLTVAAAAFAIAIVLAIAVGATMVRDTMIGLHDSKSSPPLVGTRENPQPSNALPRT